MHNASFRRRAAWDKIGFYFLATLVAAVIVIPFYWMIITALKSRDALMALPVEWFPANPSLEGFVRLFARFPFGKAFLNSAISSVCYTAITLVSASMAAFAFAKLKFRANNLLFKLYLATLMIPFQSTFIPLFIIFSKLGLNNQLVSIIIPSLFRAFAIFMLVQNMKTIPNDFIDAALMDGASYFTVFYKIVVPLVAPTLATLTVISFMDSWNDYLWPLVMLTGKNSMTLTVALSSLTSGQYGTEYNVLMAGSLISIIPIVIIYILAQRQFKSGMTLGGIKG